MTKVSIRDIAELAGITAIIASLIFVGMQIRQAQVIARAEVAMSILAAEVQIRNEMNERADIWNRGSAGEELSVDDRLIFNHLVQNLESQSYWSYTQWLGLDARYPDIAIHIFAQVLHQNPGALAEYRELRERNRKYYSIHEDPLQAVSFHDKFLEILEKQDQL
jgi:hypothetical protein